MPLMVPPPSRKVHRRLAFADASRVAADEVLRRHRAGDLEDPHEFLVPLTWYASPQRTSCSVFSGSKPSSRPDAVGDQPVEAGALVDFVEVRQRLALVEHAAVAASRHRRPVDVVQQALHQVRCRRQVLQALLILDADGVAAEIVGDPHRRDVHLALLEDLIVGQVGLLVRAGDELHALARPASRRTCLRFRVGHASASRRYSADWLSRSLNTPVGCSSSSGMMALYMPMQPSSKTPMIALSRRRSPAEARADLLGLLPGAWNASSGRTWLRVVHARASPSSQRAGRSGKTRR